MEEWKVAEGVKERLKFEITWNERKLKYYKGIKGLAEVRIP